MLPYTPLHHLLFGEAAGRPEFKALVMTSGNRSEEPIVNRNEEALPRLGRIADWFLLHNRDIHMRVDDSVVRTFDGTMRILRRSRGFTPRAIDLGRDLTPILACGAELKNTFCLTRERYALVSQHIGDLDNYETLVFFEETLKNMKKLFRIAPAAVAYDLHPLYLSTKFALALDELPKIGVQHHHAHVASCMAENGLSGPVIGVAFDGTGYGTDGRIWGGEFLVGDFAGFERRAHFRYIPLPGGDTAIREPWRAAASYLRTISESFLSVCPSAPIPPKKVALVEAMIERRVNSIDTSSCGRLFDAVAAILGLRYEISFEGQAAIDLEMLAADGIETVYPFELEEREIDFRPAIEAIVSEVRRGTQTGVIAAGFHNTVARVILDVCRRLREGDGLNRVCLSGGTFQNMYLLKRAVSGLRGAGFEVYTHAKVPPNDGGISLGQAVIANEQIARGVAPNPE
jgi:hydrogenase maturation protein HypF